MYESLYKTEIDQVKTAISKLISILWQNVTRLIPIG